MSIDALDLHVLWNQNIYQKLSAPNSFQQICPVEIISIGTTCFSTYGTIQITDARGVQYIHEIQW
mgnify:CR=1 FL=1